MPSASSFRKGSALGSIIESAIGGGVSVLNFVDFLESPLGPKISLYPVQYMMGKILFGVELTYKEASIPVYDKFREKLLYTMNEREFLAYLYDEGRTHVRDWQDLKAGGYSEMEIIAGRRAGKSRVTAACADYMLYKLLAVRNPQEYYQLDAGSTIDFTILAQDEDGAQRLYGKIRNDVNKSEFFRPYLFGSPGANTLKLVTEADRGKRDVLPSIEVASLACTTRSARGPSSIFLCLDEFAFFRNALGSRSDEVYESAKPATMQFVNPEGQRDAKIITITSPWTRVGMVWDLHQDAFRDGADSEVFVVRLSTAQMNPRADSSFLKQEFKRKEATWAAEYGGEFIDSAGSLAPPERIDSCVDWERVNATGFDPRRVGTVFFWGVDLGLKKDATALAICHWEMGPKKPVLVYDYIDRMIVGDDLHKHVDTLDIDEILDWFEDMNRWLPGAFGCTDQYAGAAFITLAELRNLSFLELVHLTGGINSQMYFALQGFINQGVARFPNNADFLRELKTGEAFYVGKTQIKFEAPNEKDAHDDMCDAVALAAWRAQKWMSEVGGKGFAFTGSQVLTGADGIRPGDLPLDPETAPMAQLRIAERTRATSRSAAYGGRDCLPPRLAARRGRF